MVHHPTMYNTLVKECRTPSSSSDPIGLYTGELRFRATLASLAFAKLLISSLRCLPMIQLRNLQTDIKIQSKPGESPRTHVDISENGWTLVQVKLKADRININIVGCDDDNGYKQNNKCMCRLILFGGVRKFTLCQIQPSPQDLTI